MTVYGEREGRRKMKKQIVTSTMHKAAFHVYAFISIFIVLVFSFCRTLIKGWFLYILFITSNIRSITMFVIVDLQSVLHLVRSYLYEILSRQGLLV
jgi:hypothetical protein